MHRQTDGQKDVILKMFRIPVWKYGEQNIDVMNKLTSSTCLHSWKAKNKIKLILITPGVQYNFKISNQIKELLFKLYITIISMLLILTISQTTNKT